MKIIYLRLRSPNCIYKLFVLRLRAFAPSAKWFWLAQDTYLNNYNIAFLACRLVY